MTPPTIAALVNEIQALRARIEPLCYAAAAAHLEEEATAYSRAMEDLLLATVALRTISDHDEERMTS